MADAEGEAGSEFCDCKVVGDGLGDAVGEAGMTDGAEAFGELAGIDGDWAVCGAEAVCGAGVEGHIGEIAVESGVVGCGRIGVFEALHLAAHDDALARG